MTLNVKEIEDYSAASGLVVQKDPAFYGYILRFVATVKKFFLELQNRFASGITPGNNGVATTVFTMSGLSGFYSVYANIQGANDTGNYGAFAVFVYDTGGSVTKRSGTNATLLTITNSGANIQVTQSSGVSPQPIEWSVFKVSA